VNEGSRAVTFARTEPGVLRLQRSLVGACLVTGSSRRFGRLICLRPAESGHSVYASMRNLTASDGELAQMCTLLELDVTDPAAVTRAVLQIVDREGRIDAVVNNAGYVLWGPVEETPVESVQRELM
jgi:NAD(P)-dependent dehydrogenase (short-subunit alcohol dehydrogenase family)